MTTGGSVTEPADGADCAFAGAPRARAVPPMAVALSSSRLRKLWGIDAGFRKKQAAQPAARCSVPQRYRSRSRSARRTTDHRRRSQHMSAPGLIRDGFEGRE